MVTNFVTPESTILDDVWYSLPLQVRDFKGFNCNHRFIFVLNRNEPWLRNVMRDGCNRLQLFFGAYRNDHGNIHHAENLNISKCGWRVVCKNEVRGKATISDFENVPSNFNQSRLTAIEDGK